MSSMDISDDSLGITENPANTSTASIVADIQSSSGLSISVHPLVILNISDHFTRTRLQNSEALSNGRVYGALLAAQTGRDVDIANSFELPVSLEGNVVLDKAFLLYKLEQLKQVFPNLDFMGWYSIGAGPTENDLKLHEQFLDINESALFLQMHPHKLAQGDAAREFPITIYESLIDIVEGNARSVFIKSAYRVELGEAERIAVDHVAKPSSSTSETGLGNTLIAHLTTQRNAIAMLNSRIQFLYQYLQDTKAGNIPVDHEILRQISSVCRRSPILEKEAFDKQFSTEHDDVLLVAYLALLTKGLNTVNDLVDKFNLVNGGNNAGGGPSSASTNQPNKMPMNKKGRHGRRRRHE